MYAHEYLLSLNYAKIPINSSISQFIFYLSSTEYLSTQVRGNYYDFIKIAEQKHCISTVFFKMDIEKFYTSPSYILLHIFVYFYIFFISCILFFNSIDF